MADKPASKPALRVTWVRSTIGHKAAARGTIRALGLHRLNQSVDVADTPEMRGMLRRVAFLIEGRVLSYAESLMGIVEAEHLGALVGGPTGGTNGGFNVVPVAGGYTLRYTGMDVRKKDGSPHHGVGIVPTVPAGRTLAGVLAGRDELLEKGIEVVSRP